MKINNKVIRLKRYDKPLFHCERSVAILLALALVLSFSLITAVPAAAANTWYVDDSAMGVNGGTSWTDAFTTIGAAITEAGPGDTINVAAGTYYKKIIIDKALTVKSTDGAENTIIQGVSTSDYYLVDIQHSDVTFDGFTVTNPTFDGTSDISGILVQNTGEPVSNVQILNNIITQIRSETGTASTVGATGINIGNGPLSDIVISGNTITDIHNPEGGASDHTCGINVWDGGENIEISNNEISDIKYNGIILE